MRSPALLFWTVLEIMESRMDQFLAAALGPARAVCGIARYPALRITLGLL